MQATRFRERLRVQIEVAPTVLPAVLPFLALQQLVDNAVRNGVERQQLGATVTVTARQDGDACLITVADDGPGILHPDVAATLRTIDDQLRERFGPRYRVVCDIAAGVGTTITLCVPAAPSHRTSE